MQFIINIHNLCNETHTHKHTHDDDVFGCCVLASAWNGLCMFSMLCGTIHVLNSAQGMYAFTWTSLTWPPAVEWRRRNTLTQHRWRADADVNVFINIEYDIYNVFVRVAPGAEATMLLYAIHSIQYIHNINWVLQL